MAETNYQVIYKGEILDGFEKDAVFRDVAKVLSISAESASKIINGQRVVLKKGLDEATARSQCILLKKAGIRVALGVPQPTAQDPDAAAGQPAGGTVAQKLARPSSPLAPPETPEDAAHKPAIDVSKPKAAPGKTPARILFEFNGSGSEYFRVWIVNILLTMVTFGIYSAWAKVRNKQYFYGNTRMHAAGFEYLASPNQILKGRAIVGGVLMAYWAISAFLPYVEAVFILAFMFLFPWLVVRSLAFNAHNSAWRNIRFGFSAGYLEAFKVYILWPLLAAATLGIFSPYAFYRQKKFRVENSSFGQSRFTFHATWKDYYRILMVVSLLSLLAVAAIGAAAYVFAPLAILALPVYLYGFAYFSVKTDNLLYNSSRLGSHRLESAMEVKGYLILALTNTLATALTLGIFHPWAKIRALNYKLDHLNLLPSGDLNTFVAGEQQAVSAVGDASGDIFDFDIGL